METNTGIEVLVVIISAILGLFLLAGIVALVYIIKVLRAIRRLTQTAERVADKAENVTEFFRDVRGPLSIARVLKNVVDSVQRHQAKSGKKEK